MNILSLRNTDHIIGADTNASIGTRTSVAPNDNPPIVYEEPAEADPIFELLGPFGNPRLSNTGKGILNMMREFQLRAAGSFFDNNNKYNTWLAPPQAPTEKRKAYQLDQIFIPKSQLCQTSNVKRKSDGAPSDHAAIAIDFHLLNGPLLKNKEGKKSGEIENKPPKVDNNILRKKEIKNFQKKVDEFFDNLSELSIFSTPSELMDDFKEHFKSAALEVAPAEVRHRPDWFTEAEEILMKCIDSRNQAFKAHMKHPSTENLQALNQARHTLLCEKRRAKRQWQLEYASKCKKSDFCLSPKDAWKMVFNLMEGFTTHHRVFRPTNFKSRNGIEAKSDSDNADILNSHFSSLFNSQVKADLSVLDNLPQHEIRHEYGNTPTPKEIQSAINSMAYDKSPRQSGLSTDMIKNLLPRAFNFYVKLIQQFWSDPAEVLL